MADGGAEPGRGGTAPAGGLAKGATESDRLVRMLSHRVDELSRTIRLQQSLGPVLLLAVAWLQPWTTLTVERGIESTEHTRGAWSSTVYFLGTPAEAIGSTTTHPNSLPIGDLLCSIGLVLAVAGMVGTALGALAVLADEVSRARVLGLRVAASATLAGLVITVVGLLILGRAVTAAPGLGMLLATAAAIWALFAAAAAADRTR